MIKRVTKIEQVIDSLDKGDKVSFYIGSGNSLSETTAEEMKNKSPKEVNKLIEQGLTLRIQR